MSSKSIAPESIEQIGQRHRSLPTRAAIADTLAQITGAIESSGMRDSSEVTVSACDELTIRLCNLHLHLSSLFCRLNDELAPRKRYAGFTVGEHFFWTHPMHNGKWHAMLTVRGCDRVLGECETEIDAYELCEQRSKLRLIGGGA